jgi:predicted nucleic acid-binding protein
MFILDTNVVSEVRKVASGKADPLVAKWADGVEPSTLFLSAITILELEAGVLKIERRDTTQGRALRDWLEGAVLPTFDGRILPVDVAVARRCARLQ